MRLPLAIAAAFATVALAGPAVSGTAEDIIAKEKCTKCHKAETSKKGPSYASLAAKYKGKAEAPARLFTQLKNGGKVGEEEDHKKLKASDDEIKAVVDFVLSSK